MSISHKEFDSAIEKMRNGIILQRLIENDGLGCPYITGESYKLGDTYISSQLGSKIRTSGLFDESEKKLITMKFRNKEVEFWQILYSPKL